MVTFLEVWQPGTPLPICPVSAYLKLRPPASTGRTNVPFRFPTAMPIATSRVCSETPGLFGQRLPAGDSARAFPTLEWDRENDRAYLTYLDERRDCSNDTDVFLRIGLGPDFRSWTNPVVIANTPGTQVHHDVSIDTDPTSERIFVSWYGARRPSDCLLDYFVTYSLGDVTNFEARFKGPYRVSLCSSTSPLFVGNDYTAIAAHGGSFVPSWGDNCSTNRIGFEIAAQRLTVEDCDDGVDNDGDGLVDCFDPACCTEPPCVAGPCAEDCGDSLDNDGDGDTDCADSDCIGTETCPEDCSDGVDNDGDALVDNDDPDCETSFAESCDDSIDNDGDLLVDCEDPECSSFASCGEICSGGIDEDHDGLIDCADPDCSQSLDCPEICDDGFDNDENGVVDCGDPACAADCGGEICGDGLDNEGDGLADCLDSDCEKVCAEICDNFVDDDAGGSVDCVDSECAGDVSCPEDCNDGLDNDGDNRVDCADPDCSAMFSEICGDGIDNDENGLVDCRDDSCDGCPACPEDCNNGLDDDGDGRIDCDDRFCEPFCRETGVPGGCSDGVDNDGTEESIVSTRTARENLIA